MKYNKKAQEEMVGFALIIIVVAVILLVFLSIGLRKDGREDVESYEVASFIQSLLQYHTSCEDSYGELDIKDLIFSCNNMEPCADETNSCDALEDVLQSIIQESWDVSPESPSKGYELIIWSNTEELVRLTEGNITNTYKGSSQDFVKRGSSIDIVFQVYS